MTHKMITNAEKDMSGGDKYLSSVYVSHYTHRLITESRNVHDVIVSLNTGHANIDTQKPELGFFFKTAWTRD